MKQERNRFSLRLVSWLLRWLELVLVVLLILSPASVYAGSSDSTRSPVSVEWTVTRKGKCYSPLVAKNALVYMGTEDGILYVFKADTGERKWTYDIREKVRCSPVVEEGVVYLASGSGKLYAVDAFTGDTLWIFEQPRATKQSFATQTSYTYISFPRVSKDKIFYSLPNARLYALSKEGGNIIWEYDPSDTFCSSPSFYQGVVYVASGKGKVHAVSSADGKLLWSYDTKGAIDSSPLASNGLVFQGTEEGVVYALKAGTGDVKWSYEASEEIANISSDFSDYVYASTGNGNLYAFSLLNGHLKWRFDTEGSVISLPSIDYGMVYIGSNDGRLYALDAESGELEWATENESYFTVSPQAAGETAYVASNVRGAKVSRIILRAYKRGDAPGKTIVIGGQKESAFFTLVVDYSSALAQFAYSSSKYQPKIPLATRISSFAGNVFLGTLTRPETDRLRGGRVTSPSRVEGSYLLRLSFFLAVLAYWLVLTAGGSIMTIIIGLAIGVWFLLMLLLGGLGFTPALLVGSFTDKSKEKHLDSSKSQFKTVRAGQRALVKATRSTYRNFWLLLGINLAIFVLGISLSWIMARSLYSNFSVGKAILIATAIWLVAIVGGGFVRSVSGGLVKCRTEQSSLKFKNIWGEARKYWIKLSIIYGLNIVILGLVCLGLGMPGLSVIIRIACLAGLLIITLIYFADNYIVFDDTTLLSSFKKSAGFTFRNIPLVLIYFTVVSLLIIILIFFGVRLTFSSLALPIYWLIIALSSIYLNQLHSYIHLESNS